VGVEKHEAVLARRLEAARPELAEPAADEAPRVDAGGRGDDRVQVAVGVRVVGKALPERLPALAGPDARVRQADGAGDDEPARAATPSP
jgi:hypothetical protein